MEAESIVHLFFLCPIVKNLWRSFGPYIMDPNWSASDFISVVRDWDKLKGKFKSLPFFFIWEVWNGRNNLIFENRPFQSHIIISNIMNWIMDWNVPSLLVSDRSFWNIPHEIFISTIYFDGASVDGITRCGVWVKFSQRERIHIYWNGGLGSNNKVEIMVLWGGLLVASNLQLQNSNFYGDSKLVIGWIYSRCDMIVSGLLGWRQRTHHLWQMLNCPCINHIYKENNTRADGLSKKGITADFGYMYILQFMDGVQIWNSTVPIP